jgi:ubiquinone biosynthesis protein
MASILTAARDLGRLREIVSVLSKHGFGELAHRMGLASFAPKGAPVGDDAKRSWPIRMRLTLQELGPCFIKLGQIASTRKDVLPPALVEELAKLQDDVEPISAEAIRGEIELSLGRAVSALFVRFDDVPLATASIGQVHRARLAAELDEPDPVAGSPPRDGAEAPEAPEKREREVVVKVQRPGVKELVERDLELLYVLAQIADRSLEELRTFDPVGMVQQFERTILAELDFGLEAQNGDRFRRNFEGNPDVRFPKAYRGVSSRRVLTLEFFDGKKLMEAVAAGFDGKRIAHQSVAIIAKMAFQDGFFHADPHPGNIIVLGTPEAPVLGLIDLGMVGRLSPDLRDKAVVLLAAAARKDSLAVADALYVMGRPTRKVDLEAYRADAALRAEKHLGRTLKEIDPAALIQDLVEGATKFGIEVPSDFLMAGKALLTIDGIGKQLDPDLDILAAAEPLFIEHLQKRLEPQELANELLRGATRYAGMARDLPFHLREVLDDLRTGRLQVNTVEAKLEPAFDRHGRRLFSAIVIASLNVAGGLALGSTWPYRGALAVTAFVLGLLLFLGHVSRDAFAAWWAKGRRRGG